jgi:hypothetical protein
MNPHKLTTNHKVAGSIPVGHTLTFRICRDAHQLVHQPITNSEQYFLRKSGLFAGIFAQL